MFYNHIELIHIFFFMLEVHMPRKVLFLYKYERRGSKKHCENPKMLPWEHLIGYWDVHFFSHQLCLLGPVELVVKISVSLFLCLLPMHGSPLKVKKNVWMLILIVPKKPRKTSKNTNFLQKLPFWGNFGSFSWFSQYRYSKYLWFFALHSVPPDVSFELSKWTLGKNFIFFTIKGDPFD